MQCLAALVCRRRSRLGQACFRGGLGLQAGLRTSAGLKWGQLVVLEYSVEAKLVVLVVVVSYST